MAPVKGSCDFCGRPSNPTNDVLYGPIHRLKDVKCHYYCLLFSSNLDQNGRDDEGILGFLLPDIKRELRRSKAVICSYCRMPGGVTSCHANKCKKRFHLPCGIEKGSLHLFYDDFRSYCSEHRKKQRVPAVALSSRDVNCSICFDPIEDLTSNDSLWAPCCRKNGWFHRLCLQKFALNAAYFFKCPLCASQDKFRDAMLRNGIYIPDQDASWELEPNAFAELLERHQQCDAGTCKCPKGRTFSSEGSRCWNLILCRNCASRGIHVGCIPGPKSSLDRRTVWDCSDCNVVIQGKRNSQGKDAAVKIQVVDDDDEDEIIVVDDDMEGYDNTCDKSVQHILSNVIQLKSNPVDIIDIENDESETVEEKVDDDEMHYASEEREAVKEEPSICELPVESSLDYGNEVDEESNLYSSKTCRRGQLSSQHWQEFYSRKRRKYFSRKRWRCSPFTHIYNSVTIFHSEYMYPSHYLGLGSSYSSLKRYHCYRNGSNCLKCFHLMEAKASKLFDNVLCDGWCEIHQSSNYINKLYSEDVCKLLWLRKAKWVCTLTSILSNLKKSSLENHFDCLTDSSSMLMDDIESDTFCDLDKIVEPGKYVNSYPEITVQFLN